MERTLEEVKKYIMEQSKKYHLSDKTAVQLCDSIVANEKGLVNELDFLTIVNTIEQLHNQREAIKQLKPIKERIGRS